MFGARPLSRALYLGKPPLPVILSRRSGYELAVDWVNARDAIATAQRQHSLADGPKVLLINGSPRSEHTCAGAFRQQFIDPDFIPLTSELDRITEAAWDAYKNSRKSPLTRKAGVGFAEMSKSYRLIALAESVLKDRGFDVALLDLSRVTSEYGRHIHPCKACFSLHPRCVTGRVPVIPITRLAKRTIG